MIVSALFAMLSRFVAVRLWRDGSWSRCCAFSIFILFIMQDLVVSPVVVVVVVVGVQIDMLDKVSKLNLCRPVKFSRRTTIEKVFYLSECRKVRRLK